MHLATSKASAATFVLNPQIDVAPDSVAPTDKITVTGSGLTLGGQATVELVDSNGVPVLDTNGDPLTQTVAVDKDGNIATTITVPDGTPAGDNTVKATDTASEETTTAPVTVTGSGGGNNGSGGSGSGPSNNGGGLAQTGANVDTWAIGSGLLVLLGLALFAIRRKGASSAN